MCILKSVGRNGKNNKNDTKTIQILLNLNLNLLPEMERLLVDGAIGEKTIAHILSFQKVIGLSQPDGRVDANGYTLGVLRSGIAMEFSADKLHGIMIHAPDKRIEEFASSFASVMPRYDINSPLRQAHFLAQLAHESASLRYTEEIASGAAYEGRLDLGNTQPGDGVRFKGRGLIQLTGRANYTEYGRDISQNLISDENYKKVAEDPDLAVDVSCWFWKKRRLNFYADQDNVNRITKRINGGYNGLKDRKKYLRRAKFFFLSNIL